MAQILDRTKDEDEAAVGPAYVPMPRDAQRRAVDRTFDEMVSDARAVKGSVFDRPFDKALRYGTGDAFGGLSPQAIGGPAVVKNASSPFFQTLRRVDPRYAGGLERVPQVFHYLDKPATAFRKGVYGVSTSIPQNRIGSVSADLAAGKLHKGPVQLTKEEIEGLVADSIKAPGSTLQTVRPGEAALKDTFHESLHGLYSPKNPITQAPNLSPRRSHELMVRILGRTDIPTSQKIKILEQYSQGTSGSHGVIESLAQFKAAKARAKHGMDVK